MHKILPTDNNFDKSLYERYQIDVQNHLIRQNISIQLRTREKIIANNKSYINFSSNDYLGLSSSLSVKRAFKKNIKRYGFGSSSSVAISGYSLLQQTLENKFAAFLNRDAAIFFNCGYLANLGVLSALVNRHDTILSDKLSHASILDGIRLSRAKHRRFLHNDASHLEQHLQKAKEHCFIITESIFSITGDIAPIESITSIAKRYKATTIIDDAHGFGYLGNQGKGVSQYYGLSQKDIPCVILSLGKSAGGYGAIVAGRKNIINAIGQWARTYRYTTALPHAIIAANITALSKLQKANHRRKRLQQLIDYFIERAHLLNLPMASTQKTPIKSIYTKDNHKTQQIQAYLLKKGFLVSCIRPPTVPEGKACIRISLNYHHSKRSIGLLLNYLKDAYGK